MIETTRKAYARAWKAWRKASEIRAAVTRLTGNRNGPAKAWADETRIILKRAERQHRRALQAAQPEEPNMAHLIVIEEKTGPDAYEARQRKMTSNQFRMHDEAQALVNEWNQKTGKPHVYEIIRDHR